MKQRCNDCGWEVKWNANSASGPSTYCFHCYICGSYNMVGITEWSPGDGPTVDTKERRIEELEAENKRLRARIKAALALHSQESFVERDGVTGRDLWESECPICKTRGTCDMVEALKGEEE